LLSRILLPELVVPFGDVVSAWVESFRSANAASDDLLTTYLLHRASHRNRRRIASVFHSVRACATAVHPFGDRHVLDAYLELPLGSIIGQGAHYLAAMYRLPALGWIPAGSSPLSLRQEFSVRWLMERAKQLARQCRWLVPAGRRPRQSARTLSPRHQRHIRMARESSLFDSAAVASAMEELSGNGRAIIKLGATALHVAVVTRCELSSAPRPTLLKRYSPGMSREVA
jgi:hypothetical protein